MFSVLDALVTMECMIFRMEILLGQQQFNGHPVIISSHTWYFHQVTQWAYIVLLLLFSKLMYLSIYIIG